MWRGWFALVAGHVDRSCGEVAGSSCGSGEVASGFCVVWLVRSHVEGPNNAVTVIWVPLFQSIRKPVNNTSK